MTDRFSVIDPAQLGTLTVIQSSDAEDILRRRMLTLKDRWAVADPPYGAQYDVEGQEFDPLKVGQEVGTSYQLSLEARVNQAARDTTLAFGKGKNLDGIASRYPGGCPRLPVVADPRPYDEAPADWEGDSRYQKRIWLSANAFGTAGSREAYEFWAMTAAPTLRDVSAVSVRTTDGPVCLITCLGDNVDGTPSETELLAVRKVMFRRDVRPLTDIVSVMGPQVVNTEYLARVYLYPGPDRAVIQETLEGRLADYLLNLRFLGKDHTDDGFAATLRIEGVTHSVERLAPAGTLRVDDTGFVRVMGTPTIVIPDQRRV